MTRRGGPPPDLARRRLLRAAVLGAPVLVLAGCTPDGGVPRDVLAAASTAALVTAAITALESTAPAGLHVEAGPSTTLARQVAEGRRSAVLVTADGEAMAIAQASGELAPPVAIATNVPAIVVPASGGAIATPADLAGGDALVSLCDASVPCGRAADALLDGLGLGEVSHHAARDADVSAVLQRVRSGEVDAGVVYASDLVRAGDDVRALDVAEVPAAATTVVAAPAPAGGNTARAVVEWLLGDDGRAAATAHGFALP